MLQSRAISEASFTFVSIREFMVVNRACFQIQGGLYFDFVYISSELFLFPDLRQWRAGQITGLRHHRRSRCATTWLPTSPSSGYSAAHLPSSPETGVTSHCESDKLSRGITFLSLVWIKPTRNNHCERGFTNHTGNDNTSLESSFRHKLVGV